LSEFSLALDAGGTKTDYVLTDETEELALVRTGTIKRMGTDEETAAYRKWYDHLRIRPPHYRQHRPHVCHSCETAVSMLARAEMALYAAQRAARNCTRILVATIDGESSDNAILPSRVCDEAHLNVTERREQNGDGEDREKTLVISANTENLLLLSIFWDG
jgi:hypothetical protein